jgi:hypothetical protein
VFRTVVYQVELVLRLTRPGERETWIVLSLLNYLYDRYITSPPPEASAERSVSLDGVEHEKTLF